MQKYSFLFKSQQPPLKNLTFVHFLTFVFTSAPHAQCNGGSSLLAFDAGNALLFSGICKTRYQKGPPTVPNMRAVLKKASYGTRRVFRSPPCSKQASGVRKGYSVPETPSYGTRRVFRGAKQPTPIRAPLIYPIRPYPSAPPHLKYGLNY